MGMFDTVRWKCPGCGKETEEQTKIGECELQFAGPKNCPVDLAAFFVKPYQPFHCDACGCDYSFKLAGLAPRGVRIEASVEGDEATPAGFDPADM